MAPSRAYVPSMALIRALSRPLPQRCPFARPLTASVTRGKRTRAAKLEKPPAPVDSKEVSQMVKTFEKNMEAVSDPNDDRWTRPLSDKELESDDLPVISWYEQDLDKGTPRRLISRLATAEDRKKEKETFGMIEESYRNPDYDDAELNRRLIDELISNPNFADLTQDLKEMRADIKSKEELEVLEKEEDEKMERESNELNANLRMATHQALQDLINDPDASAAKAELQDVLDHMPEVQDIDSPAFQAILQKATSKLNDDPTFQKKLAAMPADDGDDAKFEKEMEDWERELDEGLEEEDRDIIADSKPTSVDDIGDVDSLLEQMRDVLKSIDGDSPLTAELDAALAEDPDAEDDGSISFDREMDHEELAEELMRLAKSKAPMAMKEDDEEHVSPELQKKVDEIMKDPKLMEKLMYIQTLIAQQEASGLPSNPSAPDPTSLPSTRITTVEQRIQAARSDPQHTAALASLRVRLHPPFNISPALKSFNTAIELAYIGANDDIRRILWRSYTKARTLPTFLQNMGDEAWDIMYYSQAVTWGSNQNREAHLRLLLEDLKSLGREGPPTHPSKLAGGRVLEA